MWRLKAYNLWKRKSLTMPGTIGVVRPITRTHTLFEGTVSTTPTPSHKVYVGEYSECTVFVENSQDVEVQLTFEVSPDGENWFVLRSDEKTKVGPNSKKIFALIDRIAYFRVTSKALAQPTRGQVVIKLTGSTLM